MKKLINERSGKLFKKLFENQGIDTGKYENYSREIREEEGQYDKPSEVTGWDPHTGSGTLTIKFESGKEVEFRLTDFGMEVGEVAGHPVPALNGWTESESEVIDQAAAADIQYGEEQASALISWAQDELEYERQ